MMHKLSAMRECLEDPTRLGGEDMLGGETWKAWRVVLIAAMGETLTDDERVIFRELTGREREPGEAVEELWGIVGRRGGKSRAIAALGVYLAVCIDYRGVLAPGQVGVLPIMAAGKSQSIEIYNYAAGFLQNAPGFAGLLASDPTADTITLRSRVQIEVRAASFRRTRGFTAVAVIGDEAAFWQIETSANPDKEILDAVRPSLTTTNGPLIVISSPYSKKGEVYKAWRKHFGKDGDPLILVVKASSKTMNPSLSDKKIARAYENDAVAAASEYGAEFRNDIEGFVSREVVDAAVETGCRERAPVAGVQYQAFCDPSGGSVDSMTLAIAHGEDGGAVLDLVREEKAPFAPDAVVKAFAETLEAYGISSAEGDRYGGAWPAERFKVHGVDYQPAAKPKSDLYRELLPLLNSQRATLLDLPVLTAQLCNLERRTARGGRDSIDHPPSGADDVANSVAGVLVKVAGGASTYDTSQSWVGDIREYENVMRWRGLC